MHSYRAYNLTIHSEFALHEFPPSNLEPDVTIQRATIDLPELAPASIIRHDIEASFAGGMDEATIRWPGVATMQALGGRILKVAPDSGDFDPALMSAYVTSEALGLILHQRGLFLLHASAVAINGQALVLVGPPGAGKSTFAAACAQRGHVVLSDDLVAIDLNGREGRPHVIPGAGHVKAWPDAIAALGSKPELYAPTAPNSAKRLIHHPAGLDSSPVPLRQIVFAEPGGAFDFAPCSAADAILGLTRYFPCPSAILEGPGQRKRFADCEQLCKRVPMWRLRQPQDFSGLHRAIDLLERRLGTPEYFVVGTRPRNATLQDLLAPHGVDEFFDTYWEARPLYIRRGDEAYYDDILTADDIDAFLQNERIPLNTLKMVAHGVPLSSDELADAEDPALVDVDKLMANFGEGRTLVLNKIDRSIPKLSHYRSLIERELGFRVWFNLYISPHNAQGFAPHFDDHDVFILQISGRKRWRLYDSPVELPSNWQRYRSSGGKLGEPAVTRGLLPGDLLYIPRGTVHDADTTEEGSIHITCGMHPTYGYELIEELARVAQERPEFRRAVPHHRAGGERRVAFERNFAEQLRRLVQDLDVPTLLERRRSELDTQRRSSRRGRFRDAARLGRITLESKVQVREAVGFRIDDEGPKVVIRFNRRTIRVPKFLRESVSSALEREQPYAVGDVGGMINDEGKLELVRKLIREGLLRVVD